MIRRICESDAALLCAIYNEYVLNSRISFEESALSAGEMTQRIRRVTQHYPWLVYEAAGKIAGYIYASQWKDRSAYRHSVEVGIYIASDQLRRGIGSLLMAEQLMELKALAVHSVIGGIALPNPASVALCEKFGFKKVAHFQEVGFKLGEWIDVGYWQLIL